MKSIFILILLILPVSCSFSQENKPLILKNFNHIEYYPDATIRLATNVEGFHSVGYCIEFDSLGKPVTIGEYRSGIRYGTWYNSDGTTTYYSENFEKTHFIPGCGTGSYQNGLRFRELYERLTR